MNSDIGIGIGFRVRIIGFTAVRVGIRGVVLAFFFLVALLFQLRVHFQFFFVQSSNENGVIIDVPLSLRLQFFMPFLLLFFVKRFPGRLAIVSVLFLMFTWNVWNWPIKAIVFERHVTLGQKTNFLFRNYQEFDAWKMWILWKMRLWNREFCENWDFQNVIFRENVDFT